VIIRIIVYKKYTLQVHSCTLTFLACEHLYNLFFFYKLYNSMKLLIKLIILRRYEFKKHKFWAVNLSILKVIQLKRFKIINTWTINKTYNFLKLLNIFLFLIQFYVKIPLCYFRKISNFIFSFSCNIYQYIVKYNLLIL